MRLPSLWMATLATTLCRINRVAASASPPFPTQCVQQYQAPQLRYPPTVVLDSPSQSTPSSSQPTTDTTQAWQPPPPALLWSPWHMTYSTRPAYQALTNMQSTHYPRFPATVPVGGQIDVVSWSTSASNTSDDRVTTVFGYFAPVIDTNADSDSDSDAETVAVWRYSSTGPLANVTNLWAILGWGVDSDGVEFRVDYETGYEMAGAADTATSAPCINVASRRQGGPSAHTYAQIVAELRAVGYENADDGFVRLVGELQALRFDARREVAVEVVCDQACMDNADLVGAS